MVIECVPNFSEGRDASKIAAIAEVVAGVPGVRMLGWESDPDHHRSVMTFAGPPDAVAEAAVRATGKAAELIDLNRHAGVHPRVGAADVIPLVPLEGASIEECVRQAHWAGQEIWRRFGIPVYFYEAAARLPARRRLENVRRKGFDGRPPDVGEMAAHPTAGATLVGARGFLIAYNVDLATPDVEVARRIARRIRESSGGFPHVKAMGVGLRTRGLAQVSMNLVNFAETPVMELYHAVEQAAREAGSAIESSQIVGFVPRRAYEMAPEFYECARNFSCGRVLENRLVAGGA